MDSAENIAERWLSVFAGNVSEELLNAHVRTPGNLLWHIFSYEMVSCLKKDEARKVFDSLQYDEALYFTDGYYSKDGLVMEIVKTTGKVTSAELSNYGGWDIYITNYEQGWVYVKTHEEECGLGPYFCSLK